MTKAAAELLEPVAPGGKVVDERMIRLDLTEQQLAVAMGAGRFAVGGAHTATPDDQGYAVNAVVPDRPRQLGVADFPLLAPLLAAPETPDSLRIGFGCRPEAIDIAAALEEARSEHFKPYHGSVAYNLGEYGTGYVLDILDSQPGEKTTIKPRANIAHIAPVSTGIYLGLHYDLAPEQPDGWRERLPIERRLEADRRLVVPVAGGTRKTVAAFNFSARQFADMIQPGDPDYMPTGLDLAAYCAGHPRSLANMVLLHTTIWPGEIGVITPANAAHDGSMMGCDEPSTALIFSFKR